MWRIGNASPLSDNSGKHAGDKILEYAVIRSWMAVAKFQCFVGFIISAKN